MYGGAIVAEFYKPIFFTLIAFFIFFAREIIMDVRDFVGDKQTRVTLPLKIGKQYSVYLAGVMVMISIIILYLPFFCDLFSMWYIFLALPLTFFTIYATALSIFDLKKSNHA